MIVRKTENKDIDKVMEIISLTRSYFKGEGIPQWQGAYPERERIIDDMNRGESYVCERDGAVVGVSAIIPGIELDYLRIFDGEWRNDREYVCMHRVAVHPDAKGTGVAAMLVSKACEIAHEHGMLDLRCDTHEVNRPMRRMLEKNGFVHCGTIYLSADGEPRVAYQKCLDE